MEATSHYGRKRKPLERTVTSAQEAPKARGKKGGSKTPTKEPRTGPPTNLAGQHTIPNGSDPGASPSQSQNSSTQPETPIPQNLDSLAELASFIQNTVTATLRSTGLAVPPAPSTMPAPSANTAYHDNGHQNVITDQPQRTVVSAALCNPNLQPVHQNSHVPSQAVEDGQAVPCGTHHLPIPAQVVPGGTHHPPNPMTAVPGGTQHHPTLVHAVPGGTQHPPTLAHAVPGGMQHTPILTHAVPGGTQHPQPSHMQCQMACSIPQPFRMQCQVARSIPQPLRMQCQVACSIPQPLHSQCQVARTIHQLPRQAP